MKLDIDKIAELLGLPTWDKWSEGFDYSDTYVYAHDEVMRELTDEGVLSEEEINEKADEAGQAAEMEQSDEEFRRYYDNLMHVAEKVFGEHGLSLNPVEPPKIGYKMDADLDGLRKRRR